LPLWLCVKYFLCWQAFAGDRFHQTTESIKLSKRRVNIRRDTNSLKLLVHDRCRENAMLVEEITADRRRIYILNVHVRDRARLVRIEGSVESDPGNVFQTIHPVT